MSAIHPTKRAVWWGLLVVLLAVGIAGRVYYTPDEPREASLVMSMVHQSDWSLPELAGRTFAEKPPLLYWLSAALVRGFLGSSEWVTRLPNLGYGLLCAFALSRLGRRIGGERVGAVSGLLALTMLQSYLALIWLATDAPLVAGVSCALVGLFRLAEAPEEPLRRALVWLFAGLWIAFFAKGLAGWLVPGVGFLGVVVVERRFTVLRRGEFWVGAMLLLLSVLAWVGWVALRADGLAQLKILFWYNLAGRFTDVAAPTLYHYSDGHPNTPFKYLLELPLYGLPWLGWWLGSVRMMAQSLRANSDRGYTRLWWWTVVGVLVLLSLARTARGVYIAPLLPLMAVSMALYANRSQAVWDRLDRWLWRLNGVCLVGMAAVLTTLTAVICFAPNPPVHALWGVVAVVGFGVLVGILVTGPSMGIDALHRQLWAAVVLYSLVLAPLYGCLNQWLSLPTMAAQVTAVSARAPLQLWEPDETTQAMATLYWPQAVAADADHPPTPRATTAVVSLTSTHWAVSRYLALLGYRVGPLAAPPRPESPRGYDEFELGCRFERPGGRVLLLWVSKDQAAAVHERCRSAGLSL